MLPSHKGNTVLKHLKLLISQYHEKSSTRIQGRNGMLLENQLHEFQRNSIFQYNNAVDDLFN